MTVSWLRVLGLFAILISQTFRADAQTKPAFAIRGVLPWHNFLSGPSAWDLADYRTYLDWCKQNNINLLTLHCYTGGNERYATYVEPLIKIEFNRFVPDAYLDNSNTARWGYAPLLIKDFAFGTDTLYKGFDRNLPFGAQSSIHSRTKEEHYKSSQQLIRDVIKLAHERGIMVGIGFEFGVVPPEYYSLRELDGFYWLAKGGLVSKPTHYVSKELLKATIQNILEEYEGLDWIWLWQNEFAFMNVAPADMFSDKAFKELYDKNQSYFAGDLPEQKKAMGVWALEYIRQAYQLIKQKAPNIKIALSGWGGEHQFPPLMYGLHKALPSDIVFSCLNPGLGKARQNPILGEIAKNRNVIAIPWLEADSDLWHYQPRVSLMQDHVRLAKEMNLSGVVAIHWRTQDVKANFEAFAQTALHPDQKQTVREFYSAYLAREVGPNVSADLVNLMAELDTVKLRGNLSPEYYAFSPQWSRVPPGLQGKYRQLIPLLEKEEKRAKSATARDNLRWFRANFEFALKFDEVNDAMVDAWLFRETYYNNAVGKPVPGFSAAYSKLKQAPLHELFKIYGARIRSKGELGVLSSINQRLYTSYQTLLAFMNNLAKEGPYQAAKN